MENMQTSPETGSKTRILTAARHEFAEHGLAGARVDRIANQAGVNKAMLYYHFSSKENLYREVFRKHVTEYGKSLSSCLSVSESPERLLQSAVGFYDEMFGRRPEIRALLMRELASPHDDLLDELAVLLNEVGVPSRLLELFTDEIDRGLFRDTDVRQAIVAFITLNFGFHFMRPLMFRILKIEDCDKFMAQRQEAIVEIFLNGMKERET